MIRIPTNRTPTHPGEMLLDDLATELGSVFCATGRKKGISDDQPLYERGSLGEQTGDM